MCYLFSHTNSIHASANARSTEGVMVLLILVFRTMIISAIYLSQKKTFRPDSIHASANARSTEGVMVLLITYPPKKTTFRPKGSDNRG